MSNIRLTVVGFFVAKAKRQAIKKVNSVCSNIAKRRGHTKINQNVREFLYRYILHHPRVVKYPIENGCLYVSIYGKSEK